MVLVDRLRLCSDTFPAVAIRQVIKIAVTPAAKKLIEEFSEKNGMSEITLASRIYEWFAQQNDALRKGILGTLPEGFEVDVARLALERLAKDAKPSKGK
jgi:hypothetical protein